MNKLLAFVGASLFVWVGVHAQNTDDYRTAASGAWSNTATWERYNGTTWAAAVVAPNNTNGVITVRSPHIISMPGGVIDQVVVESGATVNHAGWVDVANGAGTDLVINGTWNYISGHLHGAGSSQINGTFTWENGEIGGPHYIAISFFTLTIGSTGVLNLSTSVNKTINRAQIVNSGTTNWNAGILIVQGMIGTDTAKFTNHGTFNIGAGSLELYGPFTSTANATINKATTGTFITMQGTFFKSQGTLNISNGTFSTSNQNSFFHNYGTINTTGSGTFNGQWNVLLHAGSFLTGNGTFIALGNWQLLGAAVIDTGTTLSHNGGVIVGPGLLTVNGTYTFSAGEIGGPNYINPGFTVVEISPTGTLNLNGSAQKILNRARVVNNGVTNWNSGEFHINGANAADTSKFVNFGTLMLGAGTLDLYGQNPSRFVNTANGIIQKNSSGTFTIKQSSYFVNNGLINISNGTFSTNNQNAFFHNYDTINTTGTGTFNGQWNVLLHAGSFLTGNGTFIALGNWQLLGAAVIDTGTTLSHNGGVMVGPGLLTVNGTYTFSAGEIGGPNYVNPGFTVVEISPTGTLNLNGSAQKILNRARVVNNGVTNWNAGEFHINGANAADTSKFVNFGTLTLGAGTLDLYGQNPSRFVNTANGIILKNSSGTFTIKQSSYFENKGLINISDGTFSTNNQNAFFHNYGTINSTNTGVFDGKWNVNLYTGTLFTGNGTINFEGNVNAAGLAVVDTGCTVNLVGWLLAGPGPFTVNGTLIWTGGKLGDYWWPKSNITINPTGTLALNGNGQREMAKSVLTNLGTVNWNSSDFYLSTTNGTDTCIFYNDGVCNLNTGAISWLGQSNTHIRNLANGIILKTSNTATSIQNSITFKNWGTVGGIGTLNMNALFVANGTFSPGLSPGTFTFNNAQPFGANSTFLVELNNNSGPGLGHDLLERNGNITIAGHLEVVETGIVPNGNYTIVNLTSGAVSGSFATATLPAGYSVDTTATTVFLVKDFRHLIAVSSSICDDDSLWFGSRWLTAAGVYLDTLLTTNALFDSIVTLTLAVNPSYQNTQTETACFTYTWPVNGQTYTNSDTVAVNLNTTAGCDSTHVLYLTINVVDTSVTVQGTTLTANATQAQYQWFDCALGIPVPGATARTFTPANSGIYYVEVTQNGCTEISGCRQITVQSAQTEAIKIYPVPVNDYLTISLRDPAATLTGAVFDAAGHLMDVQTVQNTRILKLDFRSYAAGVYLIRVETPGKEDVYKVEKL